MAEELSAAQPGEYYRLKQLPSGAAAPKRVGQGPPPKAMVIVSNGDLYELPFGSTFRASAHCDDPDGEGNRVAALDRSPPLVRCRIIDETRAQWEHLPEA